MQDTDDRLLLALDQHLSVQPAENGALIPQANDGWLPGQTPTIRSAPRWLSITLLAGAAILLLFFGITLLLRAQVQKKTRELLQSNTKLRREIQDRRLQAQNESMSNKTKYRLVVDYANEAIFLLQNGMVKFPNPKTEAMLGFNLNQSVPAKVFLTKGKADKRPFASQILEPGQTGVTVSLFST